MYFIETFGFCMLIWFLLLKPLKRVVHLDYDLVPLAASTIVGASQYKKYVGFELS